VVRAEGYTELVGDLVLTCTGGNPGAPFFANFQLFLNTNITSRLITSSQSEALLMIDEPGLPRASGRDTPFCVAAPGNNSAANTGDCAAQAGDTFQTGFNTVFYASRVQEGTAARENAIVWAGIPVVPPGSNQTRTFRFTNVRANAAGLGASQTLIPTQIVAFVSVFPPGTLPIDNPQQVVGFVQQGMIFATRNCENDDSLSVGLDQCVSEGANRDFFADPLRSGNLPAAGSFRFREGFQTAFKTQIEAGQNGAAPGVVFNSESGFVRTAAVGTSGLADSGTRLAVRFNNIPANLRIFVTTTDVPLGTGNLGAGVARAVFVSTDVNGASNLGAPAIRTPSAPFTQGDLTCEVSATNTTDTDAIEVPIVNGTGVAVWEVIASNPSVNEDFVFQFGFGFRSAAGSTQVGLGTGTATGNLAPFYAAGGTAERMQTLLPIPRFVQRTETNDVVRVQPCVTNLLFPYVTNWAGFDTGLAIANTSEDPFSDPQNRRQAGRCTLNYYGTLPNGNAPPTTRETTNADVNAGQTITMVLSTGGSLGLRGNANFQGYIIAQCDFRFAHGFAFITDGPIGTARVAEGYLALVLDGPDESGRLRGSETGESRGH
jgi:hypothetical protein